MTNQRFNLTASAHRVGGIQIGFALSLAALLAASQTAALAEPNPSGTWQARRPAEAEPPGPRRP